jgi:hypothetical protein
MDEMMQSFVAVVPDRRTGAFDIVANHFAESPGEGDTVEGRWSQTSMRMGIEGLLALKVQIETAILLAQGEDWVRNLQIMVSSVSHDPTMAETWDVPQALEIARSRYALTPEQFPVEATACQIVIPVMATEVQG